MNLPKLNCFLEEISKMLLPPPLLCCTINTEAWNVTQGLTGMAVGLQPVGRNDGHPALRWHAGWHPQGLPHGVLVVKSYFSAAYSHPGLDRHPTLSRECLQLTAPLGFLILELGSTTSATTGYFPPDALAARPPLQLCSGPGPRERSASYSTGEALARGLECRAPSRAGPHRLSGSSVASLRSCRVLPLSTDDTNARRQAHRPTPSPLQTKGACLQTGGTAKSQAFSPLGKSTRKLYPPEVFPQLAT